MKNQLTILAAFAAFALSAASGREFYVNSVEGSDSNPGTLALPWKTLSKVDSYPFQPGDTVRFARGSSFTGGFTITASGTAAEPITFGAYGDAAARPRFSNPDATALDGNAIRIRASYVVVEGLLIERCAGVTAERKPGLFGAAPVPEGDPAPSGAIFLPAGSEYNTVRDIEITTSAAGIRVCGRANRVAGNYLHENRGGPVIAVCGSGNEISDNRILENGEDSAAILLGARAARTDDTRILYNYSLRNGRFLDVAGAGSSGGLLAAYNVSDELASFARVANPALSGARMENNTIVLTRASRDGGPPRAALDFAALAGAPATALAYRNNIFYLGPAYQVSPHADLPHDHNLYYRADGIAEPWAILGAKASLGDGDKVGNPRFIDMDTEYSRNPGGFRDLRLRNNSPAVDAAAPVGHTRDYDGNPVPTGAGPDIGAFEQGTLFEVADPPPAIREAAKPANWKMPLPAPSAEGRGYYLDSRTGDDSNPGTRERPWKTLRNLDRRPFDPGDTVWFARGSDFTGGFLVTASGRRGRPITFTAYGEGPAPRLSNPDFGVLNGNTIQIAGSYIVVEELYLHHSATPKQRVRGASQITGAVFILPGADRNIVRNCEITKSPMCVHVYGQYNLVTHNYIHDNDEWPNPGWFAVGIVVANSNNEIAYNLITRCWQPSLQYGGGDGGAIEIDDRTYPKSNIYIHHNRTWANQGFLETVGGVTSIEDNIVIARNISDDYQSFALCGNCTNLRIENNTVIRVLNNGSWNGVFRFGNTVPASIRNNIFVVANAARVFEGRDTDPAIQKHDHNLYFSPPPSPLTNPQGKNVPLAQGEMIADPLFVDFAARDLRLREGSPAIDAGIPLGHAVDFDNAPATAGFAPDLGAYEQQVAPSGKAGR